MGRGRGVSEGQWPPGKGDANASQGHRVGPGGIDHRRGRVFPKGVPQSRVLFDYVLSIC